MKRSTAFALGLVCAVSACKRDAQDMPAPAESVTTVRSVAVERGAVRSWVIAEGSARAVRREYLTFDNPGRITFVRPGPDGEDLRAGDRVEQGDLLAHLDQRKVRADIAAAKAEVDQARAEQRLAESTFGRFRTLLEQKSASQQEFDEAHANSSTAGSALERARTRLDQVEVELQQTELRSPIDGILAYLNLGEGHYFSPSNIRTDNEQNLLQTIPALVIDPSSFEITLAIPSFQRDRVKVGQRAAVALDEISPDASAAGASSGGDGVFNPLESLRVQGRVHSVSPAISPGGRTVEVRVRTTAGAERLRDGMFVNVWIEGGAREDVPVVPLEALLFIDNDPHAFVIDATTGRVERRRLVLGLRGSRNELVSGAVVGDRLVTDGKFRVHDGALVHQIGTAPMRSGETPQ